VIFVTAYDQYALCAFDVNAIDYFLKPFDGARFERALGRAEAELRERSGIDARLGGADRWSAPRPPAPGGPQRQPHLHEGRRRRLS
jgi:YesN/AraC family two-component response regulator